MRRLVTLFVFIAACGPGVTPSGDEGGAGGGSGTTSTDGGGVGTLPPTATSGPPPMSTSTTAVDGTTTDGSTDDGGSFIGPGPCGDTGNGEPPPGTFPCGDIDCDIFEQDCPEGEKCTVWANDGGSAYNDTRCVPVSDSPAQAGQACTMEGGPTSGIDDCDYGTMCWGVDERTLAGRCVGFCTGSLDNPLCGEGFVCSATTGPLAMCLPQCNPLALDCPFEDEVCIPFGDDWMCAPQETNSLPGEACEFSNACAPSSACIEANDVPGCVGNAGCCSSVCDLASPDPSAACLPGQTCVPWWDPALAPEGYEDVGICSL